MIEQDTIKLLRECDAGVKMGASSLHDVLQEVRSEKLRCLLSDCRREHDLLDAEIRVRSSEEAGTVFTVLFQTL